MGGGLASLPGGGGGGCRGEVGQGRPAHFEIERE